MSEKSDIVSRLVRSKKSRDSYTRALINTIIPAQIRALRFKNRMTQKVLAKEADMKQSRISTMERPGATQFNVETLIRLASALGLGLKVEFVSFSEMLRWENGFNLDLFNPLPIDKDADFQREETPAALDVPAFTSEFEHGFVDSQVPREKEAVLLPHQVFFTTHTRPLRSLEKTINVRYIFNPRLQVGSRIVMPFSHLGAIRSQNPFKPEGVNNAEEPEVSNPFYAFIGGSNAEWGQRPSAG